jgi:hypothetical protein
MIIDVKELIHTKEIPLYNEVGFIPASSEYSTTQPFSYVELIKLIKKTPEAIGILRAIQTDIISDGFSFEGQKGKVEAVKEFLKKNRFKNEMSACLFDWLMLGNGALWKGKLSKDNLKEAARKIGRNLQVEYKEIEIKAIIDEEASKTKLLKCAPWSTMNIDMNKAKTLVSGYHQIVSGETPIKYTPEEIIHGKFMQFDGRVYGFAPTESCINVLTTMSLIKDVNGNFFQNGGVPDWMFILPKEMAGSPQAKKLEQTLRKYKGSRQKHGNLVFTGEVNPIQMNKFDKDMEFRQLSIYYTGILALAFNMPLARVASILGMEAKQNASATDLSEAGYWRSISSAQDYWEDLLNTQLFEPEFKVTFKFNRGYLNDQIKEAQRDVQMFQVIDQLIERGAVSKDYAKIKLHIPDQYWLGKWDKPEPMLGGGPFGGAMGSPGSSPKNMEKGSAGQAKVEQKKEEAKKVTERKEFDEYLEVDFDEFNSLCQKWVKNSTTRKVNMIDKTVLFLSTPDEKFKLVTSRDKLSEVFLQDIGPHLRKVK